MRQRAAAESLQRDLLIMSWKPVQRAHQESTKEPFKPLACSEEEMSQLKALAGSRTVGIWRIKRAKIILGALAGNSIERLVLETRVPPRSVAKCCQDFARQGMQYFNVPERAPTPREASVERILTFLDQPPPLSDPAWDSLKHRYFGIHFSARQIQTIRQIPLLCFSCPILLQISKLKRSAS